MTASNPNFTGSWAPLPEADDEPGEHPPIIVNIVAKDEAPEVSIVSPEDGETAQLNNIEWDGASVSFDCHFPSTNFSTHKVFTLLPNGELEVGNTWHEPWAKTSRGLIYKEPKFHKTALIVESGPFNPELAGLWELDDEDGFISVVDILICKTEFGYEISTFDEFEGVAFETRNPIWNGKALKFEVFLNSSQHMSTNVLTFIDDETADHQITHWDAWQKIVS